MTNRWNRQETHDRHAGLGLVVLAVVALVGCRPGDSAMPAEEDHAHAGGDVVTLWTDSLELFVEYPPHVAGEPSDTWAIHLTWLEGWQPVREGSLTLQFHGPGGATEQVLVNAPSRPGIFAPTATLGTTGTWRVDMTLSARGREYAIPVGQLQVFESEQALPHEEEASPAGSSIVFLKEQQWVMPFRVEVAERREIRTSIRASGQLVAPAGRLARVSAPVAGLVLARGPVVAPGDWVRAGETLAWLAPTGGVDSYATLRASVERLEREVGRAERLVAVEAIAARRLEETRHDLEVARSVLEAVTGHVTEPLDDENPYVLRLRSPISGVISERHIAPGQVVEAGAAAFTLVDPRTLWLRVHVPASEAELAGTATGASFYAEGGSRLYDTDEVVSVGSVIDEETRTLPVVLSVGNRDGALKVGMLAQGLLFVGAVVEGVSIPASAIQDEDGLKVAYVEVGGERFERRILRIGPSDARWTIVHAGIESGERVVTVGAYQVKLASLGDAEIADEGHAH